MHVVCPHCSTVNRVPEQRAGDGPVCARCRSPLLDAAPFALGDHNFDTYVTRSDLPVLVDFWADWCGPCRTMAPQFAAAAAQRPGVRFAKVDTEAARQTAARFAIRCIPSLLLFRNGREIARHAGAIGTQDILRWLDRHGAA
ncbi:thioredoxin TrxC [Methyloversatilis thermotolerans]|uniref:thioredoxin TrxC n=1 Tax=Methyloversatilis thermotolerans TaxID=1346290 RepID=UPI00036CE20C|nr:thioredoxin TrxC [Methyloversatilis thermotolerans]